jgi:dihydrolipoamide dehydrogenase
MADRYDCIIIGSGPGGYVAAIRASQLGMSTAIVESDKLGGRCLNYACIPAKSVLRAADVHSEVSAASGFGIDVSGVSVNFKNVGKHRDRVVKTLTGGVSQLMNKNNVAVYQGRGTITDQGKVAVASDSETSELSAQRIVLATGSVAKPILGLEFGNRILGTEETWALNELPKRLCVIGAGASGTEVASAFGRLGTEVVLLEALQQILPAEDEEIARYTAREIAKQNVEVSTEASVTAVDQKDKAVEVSYDNASQSFDYLCIAAGRSPDLEGLGLDQTNIDSEANGSIKVDRHMRTSLDGVYAIGDLVPGPALAHKASDEGIVAVEDAAGLETHPIDYDYIPAATFCYPQVASFGLTESQAREREHDVVIGKVPFGSVGAPTVYGERGGTVKIVGEKRYGELLGAHIVGARATDLIAELVTARDLEGGFTEVARSVHAHPTFSEAVQEAARAADGWLIHG